MREKLVIVPSKKPVGKKIFDVVMLVLAVLMVLLSAVLLPLVIPALLLLGLWYLFCYKSDIEYEYTYYDGEFRFARIKGKRKRKPLGRVSMENVVMIAPKGDPSVYKYENDSSLSYRNLTSKRPDARVYEIVFKEEKGMNRYEFEPDEEMLDAVLVRYPHTVIK